MEKILHEGKLVAIKISSLAAGSVPVTPPKEAIQVLTLKHPKGKVVAPHSHTPQRRVTESLQECLVVLRGAIRVSFYDDTEMFKQFDVSAHEACIIFSGIHSVEFLEDSEVVEIKNGPYMDDKKDIAT